MKLFIIFACIAFAHGSFIQSFLPQCKRSDPELEKCILRRVKSVRPFFQEPFKIDQLDIATAKGTANDVKTTLYNTEARRWSDFRIDNLKINFDNYKYAGEVEMTIPHLRLSADYNMYGIVFGLDFKSHGRFSGLFHNIIVRSNGVASTVMRNGVEYLKVDSVVMDLSIGGARMKMTPANHSFIGKQIAAYVNAASSEALDTMTPEIEENAARVIKQYINKFLARVPLNNLLAD